jgi:hypothetical protein
MKIYFFSTTKEIGGHEIASIRLMKEMKAHASIMCCLNSKNEEFITKLKEEKIPFKTSLLQISKDIISDKWKNETILGINLIGNFFCGTSTLLLCKALGLKLDAYVPYFLDYEEINPNDKLKTLKNYLQKRLSKHYCNFITIDLSSVEAIKKSGHNGKVFLLTNKITSIGRSKKTSREFKYDILLIGRIYFKQKGQDKAIRFLEKYSEQYGKKLKVAIAGKGVDESKLKKLIVNTKNNCQYLGHVKDVNNLYDESKVVLMPSKFEGVPLVMLECIKMGKGILVSDIEVFRRYIDSEFICDFDNETKKLYTMLNKNLKPVNNISYKEVNELKKYINENNPG